MHFWQSRIKSIKQAAAVGQSTNLKQSQIKTEKLRVLIPIQNELETNYKQAI